MTIRITYVCSCRRHVRNRILRGWPCQTSKCRCTILCKFGIRLVEQHYAYSEKYQRRVLVGRRTKVQLCYLLPHPSGKNWHRALLPTTKTRRLELSCQVECMSCSLSIGDVDLAHFDGYSPPLKDAIEDSSQTGQSCLPKRYAFMLRHAL
jgi:hypothetical protein